MTYSISHAQGELLAQGRPNSTSPVTIFQAGELRVEITLVIAAIREGGSSTEIFVYHDDDGTTYNDDTIIASDAKIEDDTDVIFQAQHPGSGIMIKPGGSLGVKVSAAGEVNFSVYGITEVIAERVRGT